MQRRDLEGLTREELIVRADGLGVPRPRTLTHAELMDEIFLRTAESEPERARARGFLGRARDLLARVVERGLHLPETARALKSAPEQDAWPSPPMPFPTITLAEIYSAQGYAERAVAVLDEVLAREPDHEEARKLRAMLIEQRPAGAAAEPVAVPAAAERIEESAAAERIEVRDDERDGARAEARAEPPTPASAAAPADATARLAAAIDDEVAALPERYDIDEIVGMPVDPETIYLYWEVRPTTLARARARRADGQLVVRLVAVLPSWDGPVVEQRDIPIDALYGDVFVREIPPGSNIRMSTGWLAGDQFEPFAVGLEIAAPRAIPSSARQHPAPQPVVEAVHAAPLEPEAIRAPHPAGAVDALLPVEAVDAPAAAPVEGGTPAKAPAKAQGAAGPQATAPTGIALAPGDAGARATEEENDGSPARAGAPDTGLGLANDAVVDDAPPLAVDDPASSAPERAGPLGEGPQRFPSGTVPTATAIARAVAATRGGSSELGRGADGPPRAPQAADPRALLGGLERPRALGGTSELWRSFDRLTRPTPDR